MIFKVNHISLQKLLLYYLFIKTEGGACFDIISSLPCDEHCFDFFICCLNAVVRYGTSATESKIQWPTCGLFLIGPNNFKERKKIRCRF